MSNFIKFTDCPPFPLFGVPWAAVICLLLDALVQPTEELDAHSIYHLLATITHPLLLISGFLDVATPAQQSVEISRQVPHADHYCDRAS